MKIFRTSEPIIGIHCMETYTTNFSCSSWGRGAVWYDNQAMGWWEGMEQSSVQGFLQAFQKGIHQY